MGVFGGKTRGRSARQTGREIDFGRHNKKKIVNLKSNLLSILFSICSGKMIERVFARARERNMRECGGA